MHTLYKQVDGIEYRVHHNSDWSGQAYVRWVENGEGQEVELPGDVLRACGRTAMLGEVAIAIGQLKV
jgi:hypothetical protein